MNFLQPKSDQQASAQQALNNQLDAGETVLWSMLKPQSPLVQFYIWSMGFIDVYPSGRETHALQPWEERPRLQRL